MTTSESDSLKKSQAETVFLNGKVVTVDAKFSIEEAVAVSGGKIVKVGSNLSIKQLVGEGTEVIDLEGKTMLPGINDSHCHYADWGLSRPPLQVNVSYPDVRSIADIVKAVERKTREIKPGEWIQGMGWDYGFLDECLADKNRQPTRWDLDAVSPDNPVALRDFSGHASWVNSRALELAGITDSGPSPAGGEIVRDAKSGEATGLLLEMAGSRVQNQIPPVTKERRKQAMLNAMAEVSSLGVTSYTDAFVDSELLDIYNAAYRDDFPGGDWLCRVNMLLNPVGFEPESPAEMEARLETMELRTGSGDEWLRVSGYKLLGDGIPPLKTAWMYEPYIGGGVGELVVMGDTMEEREDNLRRMIRAGHKNRFQVGIHSPGERTMDVICDEYMKCLESDPWDARHHAIHCDFATPDLIKRVGEFGARTGYELGMVVQSSIKWTEADMMVDLVGLERAAYMWPIKSMCDGGIKVSESSDAGVTYPNWLHGVEAAVLRESKATGTPIGPEQSVSVQQSVRNYTINGAWQTHQEDIKGSIEPGKLADFCVLDQDILTVDPREISDINNIMTVVDGRVVYNIM